MGALYWFDPSRAGPTYHNYFLPATLLLTSGQGHTTRDFFPLIRCVCKMESVRPSPEGLDVNAVVLVTLNYGLLPPISRFCRHYM